MGVNDAAAPEIGGLHGLVQGLIEQNLRRDPARARLLRRESAALIAADAGEAVTVQMHPGAAGRTGSVVVHDGDDPFADVVVVGDSTALLELAAAPLRFGLPDAFSGDGRAIIWQILRRRIRVRGLVRHLGTVRRLSMVLSAR